MVEARNKIVKKKMTTKPSFYLTLGISSVDYRDDLMPVFSIDIMPL